ncbi:MAG: ATP-binding protein [Candidatus Thiodiazotropha endolucinida]|nr:ATP-binding protein [Candidatus Thiodiazotropha taylori]
MAHRGVLFLDELPSL